MSWLLSNNRLEKVPFVSVPHTSSNRLLLSNQDKGCTPSVAHSLALPLGPALLKIWNVFVMEKTHAVYARVCLVPCSFNMANFHKYNWYVFKNVYIVSRYSSQISLLFFFHGIVAFKFVWPITYSVIYVTPNLEQYTGTIVLTCNAISIRPT